MYSLMVPCLEKNHHNFHKHKWNGYRCMSVCVGVCGVCVWGGVCVCGGGGMRWVAGMVMGNTQKHAHSGNYKTRNKQEHFSV